MASMKSILALATMAATLLAMGGESGPASKGKKINHSAILPKKQKARRNSKKQQSASRKKNRK